MIVVDVDLVLEEIYYSFVHYDNMMTRTMTMMMMMMMMELISHDSSPAVKRQMHFHHTQCIELALFSALTFFHFFLALSASFVFDRLVEL